MRQTDQILADVLHWKLESERDSGKTFICSKIIYLLKKMAKVKDFMMKGVLTIDSQKKEGRKHNVCEEARCSEDRKKDADGYKR